jgi:hypothetical protein
VRVKIMPDSARSAGRPAARSNWRPTARSNWRPMGHPGRLACVAIGAALAGLLIAGCGSASGSSASGSGSGFSAYLSCLRNHGVNVPTSPPTSAPGSGGFGGFGGGGFGGFGAGGSGNSTLQKARQACASLRPSGGFGFGGGGFATAFEAFRSCMSAHGEPIPTTRPTSPPTAGSSPADRFLNGLNPNNSKVAAALKACESKLPSFAGSS